MRPIKPGGVFWNLWQMVESQYAGVVPHVLAVGDSIAAGFPTAQLETLGSPVVNFGVGGDMVQRMIYRVQNTGIDVSQVQACVVMAGVNNLIHSDDEPAFIAQGIAELAQNLKRRICGHILVMEVMPMIDIGNSTEDKRRATNGFLKAYAKDFLVVPVSPYDPADPTLTSDGVHPSDAVYQTHFLPGIQGAMGVAPSDIGWGP